MKTDLLNVPVNYMWEMRKEAKEEKQHLGFAWFSWERSKVWKRETGQIGEKHVWGGMRKIHSPFLHMLI